jgi:EmrB/QacA subfamily drug resistance transporter
MESSDSLAGLATPIVEEARVGRRAVSPTAVLLVASIGVFMAFLDDTVVAIAFPNMVHSFPSASVSDLSWVLNAYNIAFAAFLVPAGQFADLFGRRRVYRLGILAFTLASAACALAPSIGFLIAARGIQGAAAALIVPASLALILESSTSATRSRGVAIWGASGAVAAGLGPSIGGLLVTADNWRLVFLINIPLGLLAWQLGRTELVESRAPGRRYLPDLGGALLLALAVAGLTLGIVQGPVWGWTSTGVLGAWLGALACAALFVRRSSRHPAPVLDPALLRKRVTRVTSMLALIGGAGFFGLSLANTLYLMQVWRYSPLTTGLAFTIAPFVGAVAAIATGSLVTGRESRRVVVVGALVWAVGPLLLLALMGPDPNFLGAYLPASVTLAVGLGMVHPLLGDAAVAGAPGDRYAGATATATTVRQVGAAIGVAIVIALIGTAARTGTASPFHGAWVFAFICFGSVALGALLLPRLKTESREQSDEPGERRRALPPPGSRRVSPPGLARPTAPLRDTPEALLAEVPLFAELPEQLRRTLAARCRIVSLVVPERLFGAGDPAEALYVLKSGRLDVMGEPLGRPDGVMRTLGRGAVVGELALLSGRPRSATVRCRRDATLLELSREDLDRLLREQPAFTATLMSTLGRQLQDSGPLEPAARSNSTTVAIVSVSAERPELEAALLSECAALTAATRLGRKDLGSDPGDEPIGSALARALDVAESESALVLLSAGLLGSGEWARACVAQADRVLVLLDREAAGRLPADGDDSLEGCDAVVLDDGDDAQQLLDELKPRVTHLIRPGTDERDDLARLARRLAGQSVGLVLSGGGARSFAHIGVIEELLAAGVVIDRIGAAGMGAFVGGLLARGLEPVEIDACCYDEWVRREPLSDYRVPRVSLVRGRRVARMLERTLPGLIEGLPRSFYCVASDIVTGEVVTLRRGALAKAVEASMCLPGVVPPVAIGAHLLVDGGVLDSVPINAMLEEADGPIIVSDVTAHEDVSDNSDAGAVQLGLIETVTRAMLLRGTDASSYARRHAGLYISPAPEAVGVREFHMLDRMREAGRRAALEALESGSTPPG